MSLPQCGDTIFLYQATHACKAYLILKIPGIYHKLYVFRFIRTNLPTKLMQNPHIPTPPLRQQTYGSSEILYPLPIYIFMRYHPRIVSRRQPYSKREL